jgi:hypothetical protein
MRKKQNAKHLNVSLAPAGGEGRGEGVFPQTQPVVRRHQFQNTALVERSPHPSPLPPRRRGKPFEDFQRHSRVMGGVTQ